jgi:outer membrane receptor protein involved in Fe transport
MKRIILLFIIFSITLTAKAQLGIGGGGSSVVGKIAGTIIDSLTKKPVDYATISLFRSGGKAPINGVLTDEKGNFKIDNIKAGKYKIVVSFIGYPSKTIDPVETTASKPDNNMGTILLAPSAKALKEVSIVGQAALVENKIDKIVYNAEKDLTAAGGTATDLLSKVPMVSVDLNGNVSVRGDANVRVLINGKPSGATSASLSDVLKSIPADQIKSIEVITSPSAKYDAEGSAGIINIITKQKNVSGFSGGISGGVGTRQNNGNMNLSYNKNRFNFNANMGGNASWPQTTKLEFGQFIGADSTITHGTSRLTRHAVIGSVGAGYQFNGFNSINTTLKFNQIRFGTEGDNSSNSSIPANIYDNHSIGMNKIDGFDWNIDYTHKFKKEGEEISFSTQWSHSSGISDYSNLYSVQNVDRQNIKNNIDGKNNEYTVQLDYTLPINKVFKLEAGGKSIFRRLNSTSNYFAPTSGTEFSGIPDPATSNQYAYDQNVFAGYSVFTITLPKNWTLLAGFRLENTDIHGEPFNAVQSVTPFDQNYNTYVPSLTIQKKLTASNTLKLGYSKRITRPSLQFLNPFVNQSNIQAQQVGNPTLSPEVSQTVELALNSFIKSSILNVSVYYKHTDGLIESIADTLTTGFGTLSTYNNVGQNNSVGGSVFASVTPFKFLTVLGNFNAYTYHATVAPQYLNDFTSTGTYFQYGGFLRATATLPSNFLAEAFAFGNSARRTIQGSQPTFSIFGVGVKRQFMQKKMAIGINIISPFAEYKSFNSRTEGNGYRTYSNFQLPFRSYGITFSYSFGKLSFSNPNQNKKGINNDDMKQGDQGAGGGGAPAGGR